MLLLVSEPIPDRVALRATVSAPVPSVPPSSIMVPAETVTVPVLSHAPLTVILLLPILLKLSMLLTLPSNV